MVALICIKGLLDKCLACLSLALMPQCPHTLDHDSPE